MTCIKPRSAGLAKLWAFERANLSVDTFWMSLMTGIALVLALSMRPWRLLARADLWTPLLATGVILPWFWALPRLQAMPLQLQFSGAVLVLLCLGWPLTVWVLAAVSVLSAWLAPQALSAQISDLFFLGILPATLALGLGAAMRRWLPHHPFVYILGRGFLGTALCLFAARGLETWLQAPGALQSTDTPLVAQWLMAWGDAFLTGLMTAVAVAFKPQWLATWSDRLYLQPPPAPEDQP